LYPGESCDGVVAVVAGVLREAKEVIAQGGFGVDEAVSLREDAADFAAEGSLEMDAGGVPVVFGHLAGEGEDVDPLIAFREHFGEERFAAGELIVTEIEEVSEGGVEFGIAATELFEGAAGGEGVEGGGVFSGLEMAAEAGGERAIVSDTEAEGIDGLDSEALRMVEEIPAAAFGLGEGFASEDDARELVGRETAAAGGGFEIENDAGTHFRSGGTGEGDGEDIFRFVDGGEEAEEAAGEEVGFAGACGGLNDDGAADVDSSGAGFGVGDEGIRHRSPRRRFCRRG
jgi:hypothetical protein